MSQKRLQTPQSPIMTPNPSVTLDELRGLYDLATRAPKTISETIWLRQLGDRLAHLADLAEKIQTGQDRDLTREDTN